MCGVLGVSSEICHKEKMDMALHSINHRGPDFQKWIQIDDVYLGHSRLSIIDLSSSSNQPLWDVNEKACIIFNGEIYNYQSIRDDLSQKGHEFNTDGDAEVILNLYLSGEPDWLSMLDGIFSLAIYVVESKKLTIARDKYGVKPLYYTQTSTGFYFSSEIKALLKFPSVSRDLNYDAILRSIVFLWSPGPSTILKNIQKLEPATVIIVEGSEVTQKSTYWEWPASISAPNLDEISATNAVSLSLKNSVESQLVSDVPVGAFLSGGVDSSLIAAIAKEKLGRTFECFTIDTVDKENDGFSEDLPYAKKVAELLGLSLNVVEAKSDVVNDLAKMIYYLDEPQADPAAISVLKICELAKEKNIKVLLSGAGGDDLFTGYRRHTAVSYEKAWSWLPLIIRKMIKACSIYIPTNHVILRRVAKALKYVDLRNNERILSYFYWLDPSAAKGLFSENAIRQLSENPMSELVSEVSARKDSSSIEKMLYLERRYFLVDHNFNYTDKMSMASGVEVRVPFLNDAVINAASKIPDSLKQKGGVGKYILKKSAEKYLPKSIVYRAKTGFGSPLRKWLKGDLKELVDDVLSPGNISKRGVFDSDAVWELIELDRKGKGDYSYSIFSLLCIEIWCRIFIDGETPEGVNN